MPRILPKTAAYSQKLPKDNYLAETSEIHQKMTFYFFPNFIFSKCGKIIKACSYGSDFEYNNFLYALFNVKNQPLHLNFSIPLCENNVFLKVLYVL